MSRTDKDNPWWVDAKEYEPVHRHGWIKRAKYRKEPREWKRFVKNADDEYRWETFSYYVKVVESFYWEDRGDCDLPNLPNRKRDMRNRNHHHLGVKPTSRCYWEPDWY